MKNELRNGCKKWGGFSILFPCIFRVFSVWFSLRFSKVHFRIRAVVAKCGMPEYYGFYNGFWRFSSFTFFWKMAKKHRISSRTSMQKKSEIQCRISLKIRCKKTWKLMKNQWKLTPESRPSKKKVQKWDFLWIGLLLGVHGGPRATQSRQKGGSRRHAENSEKNEGRASSQRKLKRQCFYLNIWFVLYLSIYLSIDLYLSICIYLSIYLPN